MGTAINNGRQVRFPSVSPDGKYLFFVRSANSSYDDVFWMSSEIIEQLRTER
jgi:Tol biopolymer transport system component